jgi:cytochrome d ubiquinol oxidase subunit II
MLPAAYVLLGACWLVMKTEDELQTQAIAWAKLAWVPMVVGMGLISLATPWVSETVRSRWFHMPEFIALLPIPLMTLAALVGARAMLNSSRVRGKLCWLPFTLTVMVFVLGAIGLAYSLYPFVVMDRLTLWQAAAAPGSLKFILVGVCIAVPAIAGYTVYAYRVFSGKAGELSYA